MNYYNFFIDKEVWVIRIMDLNRMGIIFYLHIIERNRMELSYTREEALKKLLRAYQSSYNIEAADPSMDPLVNVCHFYQHTSKYVMSRKAELWSADTTEHVYIFSVPNLTAEIYKSCEKLAYEQGMELIDPKPGHMCTYITAVFLCDSYTDEALKLLKKCKLFKSFHFSLRGWMDFHSVAINLPKEEILHNRIGHSTAKILKKILYKQKKGRIRL